MLIPAIHSISHWRAFWRTPWNWGEAQGSIWELTARWPLHRNIGLFRGTQKQRSDMMTGGHMNYSRLVCRHVYHHMGHILFSSAFHTARVVWVLPHKQVLGGCLWFLVRDLRECFDRLPGGGLIRPNSLYE